MSQPMTDRDLLAKIVREAWVAYCVETGHTDRPSHLAPWEEMGDWDREADRRIAAAVAGHFALQMTTLELRLQETFAMMAKQEGEWKQKIVEYGQRIAELDGQKDEGRIEARVRLMEKAALERDLTEKEILVRDLNASVDTAREVSRDSTARFTERHATMKNMLDGAGVNVLGFPDDLPLRLDALIAERAMWKARALGAEDEAAGLRLAAEQARALKAEDAKAETEEFRVGYRVVFRNGNEGTVTEVSALGDGDSVRVVLDNGTAAYSQSSELHLGVPLVVGDRVVMPSDHTGTVCRVYYDTSQKRIVRVVSDGDGTSGAMIDFLPQDLRRAPPLKVDEGRDDERQLALARQRGDAYRSRALVLLPRIRSLRTELGNANRSRSRWIDESNNAKREVKQAQDETGKMTRERDAYRRYFRSRMALGEHELSHCPQCERDGVCIRRGAIEAENMRAFNTIMWGDFDPLQEMPDLMRPPRV